MRRRAACLGIQIARSCSLIAKESLSGALCLQTLKVCRDACIDQIVSLTDTFHSSLRIFRKQCCVEWCEFSWLNRYRAPVLIGTYVIMKAIPVLASSEKPKIWFDQLGRCRLEAGDYILFQHPLVLPFKFIAASRLVRSIVCL